MYAAEVPKYDELLSIVREVDQKQSRDTPLPERHWLERHGAIRVGTEWEMQMFRRIFALFDMHPVGYYDLSIAGLPLHATAFRAINSQSLASNPFRIFASLLRQDRLESGVRDATQSMLSRRQLFTPRLRCLVEKAELDPHSGLSSEDACALIEDVLKAMKWHSQATVSYEEYIALQRVHPVVADIVCFPSAHINHLTPCTLDIDQVQSRMIHRGLPAKSCIEGPPERRCPILLRQTSFHALEEAVYFPNAGSNQLSILKSHTARFGGVEQRGAAVTRKGRRLYDYLYARWQCGDGDFETLFRLEFPDSWQELHDQELVYFRYSLTHSSCPRDWSTRMACESRTPTMQHLIDLGLVEYHPITYEDFLPLSAAGIFASNLSIRPDYRTLSTCTEQAVDQTNDKAGLELALGCKILDYFALYDQARQESIEQCARALGLDSINLKLIDART